MTAEETTAFAAKEAEAKELATKLAAAEKQVSDKEDMIKKQSAEVGDGRKEKDELAVTTKKLAEELIEAHKAEKEAQLKVSKANEELAELREKGPTGEPQKTRQTTEERIKALESKLTDKDREAMDKAISNADDATKAEIESDDKTYLLFLEELRASNPEPSVPRWRKTPETKPADDNDARRKSIKKMFENEQRRADYIPGGPSGGTHRNMPDGKRLPTGQQKANWIPNG